MTTVTGNVDNKHEIYQKFYPIWKKIEIVNEGEDAVHEAGVLLMPRLPTFDDNDYKYYVERTRFLNAFSRTLQGLKGMVTRKETVVTEPDSSSIGDAVTSEAESMVDYSENVLEERLKFNVCGTLIDHPTVTEEMTVAEKEKLQLQPTMSFYKAESIINWKYDTKDNKRFLSMVVLHEAVSDWVNDFETEVINQYRVLKLDDDGYYYQQLHKEINGQLVEQEVVYPEMDSKKLQQIPFFFHGEHTKPPLYDLCTNNVKHYQLKGEHTHALHFVALPTPIFTGCDKNDFDGSIGPGNSKVLENPDAKAFYLEFEGKGLSEITTELEDIKKDMAYLGAAMLAPDNVNDETATKANIRNNAETSSLAELVKDTNKSLTEAFRFLALWNDAPEDQLQEYSVAMSTDLNVTGLSPQALVALVQAWQSGAFGKQTLFQNLQKGEIIDGTKSFDEEQEEINNQAP